MDNRNNESLDDLQARFLEIFHSLSDEDQDAMRLVVDYMVVRPPGNKMTMQDMDALLSAAKHIQ